MSTSVNISVLGLTNPDVNRKRMHQLYIVNNVTNDCSNGFELDLFDFILYVPLNNISVMSGRDDTL